MTTAETAQMNRTDENAPDAADQPTGAAHYEQPEGEVIDLTILGKSSWLMLKIVLPLLVCAFLVTLMFATVQQALVATFTMFVLMLFIAIPLFLACLEDEIIEPETPEVHPETAIADQIEPDPLRSDAGVDEQLKTDGDSK